MYLLTAMTFALVARENIAMPACLFVNEKGIPKGKHCKSGVAQQKRVAAKQRNIKRRK
jgi:hypothetical protein